MTIQFDEKGKFYTDVVAKKTIQSTIQTITNRLEGNLHVKADNRLIDELKISGQFIALTDATIYNPRGEVLTGRRAGEDGAQNLGAGQASTDMVCASESRHLG